MGDEFLQLLVRRYDALKAQFPGEGRRKWCLRVLDEFWLSDLPAAAAATGAPTAPAEEYPGDDDPLDAINGEGPQLGLLLRTDFSNDDAWQAFCARLKSEEDELIASVPADGPSTTAADVNMTNGDDSDSESDEEGDGGLSAPLIKIVDPPSAQDRSLLQGISNLRALRLFNDVNVRPAPPPPAGTRRVSPPNRLVDRKGWQEVYSGLTLWVYDAQSNADQCARLVSPKGGVYGTATGDSWRAKVSHLPELQFNMSVLGMKIDFGGMDRYDYPERRRNLDEAEGAA